ncbi:hypothetical protein TNCV_675411 [Trichonephila clavipes]|nr:hypothetical protein TNCV_675411 [Trichonephila clavipes]
MSSIDLTDDSIQQIFSHFPEFVYMYPRHTLKWREPRTRCLPSNVREINHLGIRLDDLSRHHIEWPHTPLYLCKMHYNYCQVYG